MAVAPNGNVYITDGNSHRVQELDSSGNFVAMFGKEVNGTTHADVCTEQEIEKSGVQCQAGVSGGSPVQFAELGSVAVDPVSDDVYIIDTVNGEVGGEFAFAQRVQVFSPDGQFLFAIGKSVNRTNNTNACAGAECQPAALQTTVAAEANTEPGAFDVAAQDGNLLAFGGAKDDLYVGDRARVQEFNSSTGASVGGVSLAEISPTGQASGVAVDSAGDVFVSDSEAAGVHEYDSSGVLQSLVIDGASSGLRGLALDPHGRLGVLDPKEGTHGVLYNSTGVRISEFAPASGQIPGFAGGLAFGPSDEAYVVNSGTQQLETYTPVVFPETRTCAPSEVTGTSAKLCGEINPDGVHATGFFQYGKTSALGSSTQSAFEGETEAFESASLLLTGLVPNQEYEYRVAVEAQANGEKLQGHGEEVSFHTPVVGPQIPGSPNASFVTSQRADIEASVNPEHTATSYHFEYGACQALSDCVAVLDTPSQESSLYGIVGATSEISGLAPSTTYSYRLVASNEFEEAGKKVGGQTSGAEGSFTTAPATAPSAETGGYAAVTSTSAVIFGAVNPDGLPAGYAFELGVYDGAATQYTIVFSGPAGSSSVSTQEEVALTGLQPGTTYAYRIAVSSGYIANESHTLQGAPLAFTTAGVPSVLLSPATPSMLPPPPIAFPKVPPPVPKCKRGLVRNRHGKCVKVKQKKRKKKRH